MQAKLLIFLDGVYSHAKLVDIQDPPIKNYLFLSDLKTLKGEPIVNSGEIIFRDDKMYKLKVEPEGCIMLSEQGIYSTTLYYELFETPDIYSKPITRFDFYFLNILLYLRKESGFGTSTMKDAVKEAKEIINYLEHGQ
jgi:hypothetical protein